MTGVVLAIGGMDSSGGAGLLRDAATVAALGRQMRAAVTSVTAQTDQTVAASHPMPAEVVLAQIASAGPVDAVKIGMLGTAEIVRALAPALPQAPCILDPVLLSSSGHSLLEDTGVSHLLNDLLPRVDLLTPNLPEVFSLASRLGYHGKDPAEAARPLLQTGLRAVLVKGGHATGEESVDLLFRRGQAPLSFAQPRLNATLRGTGCRLASAIACEVAKGAQREAAILAAKAFVHRELTSAAR